MEFNISGKKIGDGRKAFIIAELSANHAGKFNVAVKTIKAMKAAGADAVKLQTYTPDTMTINSDKKYFKIKQGTPWDGKILYDLYREAYTPWEWQSKLQKVAQDEGLIFFSTPFDRSAVDFLESLNVPAYKISSFEMTDIPLIEYIAGKGKPVIISTGIADLEEIKDAVAACRRMGNDRIALLKCTSAYPTPLSEVNLETIRDMKKRFSAVIGISDHTLDFVVPAAAAALGAGIIEKHFILDRKQGGPDATFSLEPKQFSAMVKAVRDTEAAMGKICYGLRGKLKKGREFSRSLFVVKDIGKGELFSGQNIRSIRPGFGLPPKYLNKVIGKRAKIDLESGTPLSFKHISAKSERDRK